MVKVFGTDGIRGTANSYPMTPEMALKVGKAVALLFKEKNGKKRHRIVIGKDTRLSGYMLETALTSGIVSMGVNVYLVGPMPTPAVAHLTKSLNCDAGLVLSASHNPAEDNGIKIFGPDGYKLSDELETEIESLLSSDNLLTMASQPKKIGKAFRLDDARGRYIEFVKSSINNNSLNGLKIVLDSANGAAYSIAPKVFSELGAKVKNLNNKPNGLNINLNCGASYPETLMREVVKSKADIGIAFDGDADRVMVCDEKGNLIDGDLIMSIVAIDLLNKKMLSKKTVVGTVMTNSGIEAFLNSQKIKLVRTKVGDRYVIEEMKKHGYILGGESSGHIIFNEHSTTGDGILTALQLVNIIKKSGKKLSELSKGITVFPMVLKNIKVKQKIPFENLPSVQKEIKNAEKKLKKNGRVLVRYSGTENLCRVMVEGKDSKLIKDLAEKISSEIKGVLK